MKEKINLTLDKQVKEKGKKLAHENYIPSFSRLVERLIEYLEKNQEILKKES